MSVYNEIVEWTFNKPMFVRDAVRRLIKNHHLTDADINELTLILKKEVGFREIEIEGKPVAKTDVPILFGAGYNDVRLTSISQPTNINALYNNASLTFSPNNLSIVYGNNGSGKSSYARILKKLCWSRHKNIELKKNVYTKELSYQSVNISFDYSGRQEQFVWRENGETHPILNSIYVFDSHCSSIYLNNENLTEYKPNGIHLLEKLLVVCSRIEQGLNKEIKLLSAQKPFLDPNRFLLTNCLKWYNKIESLSWEEVDATLIFSTEQKSRLDELSFALSQSDPAMDNKRIQLQIGRYRTEMLELTKIENLYSEEAIKYLIDLKSDFLAKKTAYAIAKRSIDGDNPLKGVGSNTWKNLWEAAKLYATNEVHPNSNNFPTDLSAETCVFCQQSLSAEAQARLDRFNLFVQDITNKEFTEAEYKLDLKITDYKGQIFIESDTHKELLESSKSFNLGSKDFQIQISKAKDKILSFLVEENLETIELGFPLIKLSELVSIQIQGLEEAIKKNNGIIEDRTVMQAEYTELCAIELLFKEKEVIQNYHSENNLKNWLNQCKSKINQAIVSKKIGSILESRAIELQHTEFIEHLSTLSKGIASKVSIKKTKTVNGSTFQKCSFSELTESIPNVLSEGEQKIIALANFLSECTIDKTRNTIVFDDPVTSLDEEFREAIADKICTLAQSRQIIIHTHDLYFVRLLMDIYSAKYKKDTDLICLSSNKGISGIVSDEIPYLGKNIQERITTINKQLKTIKAYTPEQTDLIDVQLDSARKRFRMLIDKSVEDLLANKSIERFSKNIQVKHGSLSSFVIVNHEDIKFLLNLYSKYSTTEHDGGIHTIAILPDENEMIVDLKNFSDWNIEFAARLKEFKKEHNYR